MIQLIIAFFLSIQWGVSNRLLYQEPQDATCPILHLCRWCLFRTMLKHLSPCPIILLKILLNRLFFVSATSSFSVVDRFLIKFVSIFIEQLLIHAAFHLVCFEFSPFLRLRGQVWLPHISMSPSIPWFQLGRFCTVHGILQLEISLELGSLLLPTSCYFPFICQLFKLN